MSEQPLQDAMDRLNASSSTLIAGVRETLDQLEALSLDELRLTGGQLTSAAAQLAGVTRVVAGANGSGAPPEIFLDPQTSARVAGARQKSVEIVAQFQKLDALIDEHTEELRARVQGLENDLSEARKDIEDWKDSTGEQLDATRSAVDEAIREAIEHAAEELEERKQRLRELIEERLIAEPATLLDELVQDLKDWMKNTQAILAGAADRLQSMSTETVRALTDESLDSARAAVDEKVREIIEQVLRDLAADVVESTGLTQIGVSLTSALAPILPQLIAAKLLLGQIKSLLEAMRMGT